MMNLCLALLALGAPAQPGTQENPTAAMLRTFGLMGGMLVIMYLIIIRPQRNRQKQLDALLKNVKAGDKVVTSGGIIGTVISVKDKSVSIRSADSKFEILKSTISEITEKAGDTAVQS
jgi:preprotein translocase subunit YajC